MVKPQSVGLACPQCRNRCSISSVSCVESHETPPPAPSRLVQGNYSTKVEAVITETLHLTQQQPDVKILVFSAVRALSKFSLILEVLNGAIRGPLGRSAVRTPHYAAH